MTPEEKLNHLKNWMERWINARAATICATNDCFFVFDNYGMLWLSKGSTLTTETFDEYLSAIS